MKFTTTNCDTRAVVRCEAAEDTATTTFLFIDTTPAGGYGVGYAYLSPDEARQLIDALELRAAPRRPEPLPPIDVAEVLDAALAEQLYEVVFTHRSAPNVVERAVLHGCDGAYPAAEAQRWAARCQHTRGPGYHYFTRPVSRHA